MTQMQSTRLPAHTYYSAMADRLARDPVVEYQGRATVPMGRGFGLWQRMNKGVELVWVTDCDGRPRGLTPTQASVISFALSNMDGPMLTMRAMAASLGVHASTVSRALAKAQAWGLLVYMVGKGRFAGLVIVRYVRDGGFMDDKRKAAKARVRRWSESVQRRLSRLQVNVAPYILEGGRGVDSLYYYLLSIDSSKSATLTAQLSREWTAEDVAGVV